MQITWRSAVGPVGPILPIKQYQFKQQQLTMLLSKQKRKPLQIEIVEDDMFERQKEVKDITLENIQISHGHHLSHHSSNSNSSIEQESMQQTSSRPTTYRNEHEIRRNSAMVSPTEAQTWKYRLQLLQQELRKERKEKEQLLEIVNSIKKKKHELDRLYEQQSQRQHELENLRIAASRLKQINRCLQQDLSQERQYSRKLEQQVQDAMNYKNIGLKAESYLQKVRSLNENKENVGCRQPRNKQRDSFH